MGAGVSAGENNDDLIDNLIEASYIKTALVERVFRAVDRGAYFLPEPPADAYRDVAWKNGNFHISAPCIYSEVMEGLKLKPGLSFLNLGSGTGYLSTLAGLILGSYGINHGIELHADVIHYAYMRLEEFKRRSGAIDEFDFCQPKFMQGNCLCLTSGFNQYDRVYCGAACPEKYLNYIKNFVKIGGILVVPVSERLVELKRLTETLWSTQYLLPVSFTNLVRPEHGTQDVACFDVQPLSLQDLCRAAIRNLLRKAIETEQPKVKSIKRKRKASKKKKPVKRDLNGRRDTSRASEELLDFFLLTIARKKKRVNTTVQERATASSSVNREISSESDESSSEDDSEEAFDIFNRKRRQAPALTRDNPQNNAEEASGSNQVIEENETEGEVIVHKSNTPNDVDQTVGYNITVQPMVVEEISDDKNQHNEGNVRDKLDSGLLASELPVDLVETVSSSSDEDQEHKRYKRAIKDRRANPKWPKIEKLGTSQTYESGDSTDNDDKSDSESEYANAMHQMKMYVSPYTIHMRNKIQQLPLPINVKKFLNYYREF